MRRFTRLEIVTETTSGGDFYRVKLTKQFDDGTEQVFEKPGGPVRSLSDIHYALDLARTMVVMTPSEPDAFTVIWGAGETEQGRQSFANLDAVRGMLAHDTDLNAEQIEELILKGKRSDADDDPAACTQFDCAWIRLERKGA